MPPPGRNRQPFRAPGIGLNILFAFSIKLYRAKRLQHLPMALFHPASAPRWKAFKRMGSKSTRVWNMWATIRGPILREASQIDVSQARGSTSFLCKVWTLWRGIHVQILFESGTYCLNSNMNSIHWMPKAFITSQRTLHVNFTIKSFSFAVGFALN